MANADASTTGAADLDSDDVVTVTTLNDEIADVIEDKSDLDHQYVVGDVSDCRESNRHLHFDLMSEEASIHCVVFWFRNQACHRKDLMAGSLNEIGIVILQTMAWRPNLLTQYRQNAGVWRIYDTLQELDPNARPRSGEVT